MIISHKHKLLFIELPLTGSTAISRELRENYGGENILFKHATYEDFLRIAEPRERQYFVFSGIRNPLDKAVSYYFKYKTDHQNQFSEQRRDKGKRAITFIAEHFWRNARYTFVSEGRATFPEFFKSFYRYPYSDWSVVSHKKFDDIIRFENLQDDFRRSLERAGASMVRPLPMRNKTADKDDDFLSYYTPEIVPLAKKVFGPYMKFWGYEFPTNWGENRPSLTAQVKYNIFTYPKIVYWKYLRNRF